MPRVVDRTTAFSTPWFEVISKTIEGHPSSPHFTVLPHDYVTVFATTASGDVLLVRQYRPVIEDYTLELPSGLIDTGESPEQCALRELVEETGHVADEVEHVGTLVPDVGRLGNRMFCYAAANVRPIVPAPALEEGLELVVCSVDEFVGHLQAGRCAHALNYAAILLAMLRGRFALPGSIRAGGDGA